MVDAGDFKHELLNRLRSTMAVNVLSLHVLSDIFVRFSTNFRISRADLRRGDQQQSFTEIHPVEPRRYRHTDTRTNGRTDRHDEVNKRSSQFCESA